MRQFAIRVIIARQGHCKTSSNWQQYEHFQLEPETTAPEIQFKFHYILLKLMLLTDLNVNRRTTDHNPEEGAGQGRWPSPGQEGGHHGSAPRLPFSSSLLGLLQESPQTPPFSSSTQFSPSPSIGAHGVS